MSIYIKSTYLSLLLTTIISMGCRGNTDTLPKQISFYEQCNADISKARTLLAEILAVDDVRTIENTIKPYNAMSIALENGWGMAYLARSVHPQEDIRNQATECEKQASQFSTKTSLNSTLYDAIKQVDISRADKKTKRFVRFTLRDFKRSGVNLPSKQRQRLSEINKELTQLGLAFDKNIVTDVRYITITDLSELSGLPQDWIETRTKDSQGNIVVSTDSPDYVPILTYADNTNLRKRLYTQRISRAKNTNKDVLKKMLIFRDEKAKLLGYKNYADYITADKMMKSGRKADAFIQKVSSLSKARGKKDYNALLERKRQDNPNASHVESYEKSYYTNKITTEKYNVDQQIVREYFDYNRVEKALLDLTSRLYNISYKRVTDIPTWHSDVKVFDVFKNKETIGRIYLDMHPRDNKYKHAAKFSLRSGVVDVQIPEGVLVCNFPKPQNNKPALMELSQVNTMFHEFGHLMHHVFGGQQQYASQSGTATERDFVEAPSQMFEEWLLHYDLLKHFALHYKTNQPIPLILVNKIKKSNRFGRGVSVQQQMFYADLSLSLHRANPNKLNLDTMIKKLQKKHTPFPFVDGTAMYASFGHLKGYSAMYYTYMWSLSIAKDMISPFRKYGLLSPKWNTRYRDKILTPGGSKDAKDLVSDFLGRPYNLKMFNAWLKE